MLYCLIAHIVCIASKCHTCSVYQQQRSRSIMPRPNISALSYPLPCHYITEMYLSLN